MESTFPDELVVEVKQEHIDADIPPSRMRCVACPIALAANEAMPVGIASAGPYRISFHDPQNGRVLAEYRMPVYASDFIRDFDNNRHVQPFTFTAKRIK